MAGFVIVSELRERGVGFSLPHENLDTLTPEGRLVLHAVEGRLTPATNRPLDIQDRRRVGTRRREIAQDTGLSAGLRDTVLRIAFDRRVR
ncbi:hypothetical protein [Streptomyces viridosporus]|uniref:hypothetical protein n=1 Tax=Streptomyces viridosporus TaxID=67581 RepID=UPI0009C040A9|nr:hypothetical protein [Streptomyces viridosporus]